MSSCTLILSDTSSSSPPACMGAQPFLHVRLPDDLDLAPLGSLVLLERLQVLAEMRVAEAGERARKPLAHTLAHNAHRESEGETGMQRKES